MKLLITEEQYKLLFEYIEQVDKQYVKTGIFDDQDRKIILSITNGDVWTKLIADMYYFLEIKFLEKGKPKIISQTVLNGLDIAHEQLMRYNKNLIPIKDLFATENKYSHPLATLNSLNARDRIIDKLSIIPKIYLRNLKSDLNTERGEYEIRELEKNINRLINDLELINKIPEDYRKTVLNKLFSSENNTIEKVVQRLNDIFLPYLNEDSSIDDIIEKVNDMDGEAEIIFNKDNIIAIVIKSVEAMQHIGCSSQWCFARESGEQYWDDYVTVDYPIIVFDLNEEPSAPTRMVVILDSGEIYSMYNDVLEYEPDYFYSISKVINKYRKTHSIKNMAMAD